MSAIESTSGLYGLLAEFDTPEELVAATRTVTAAGYTRTDGFSPFPIHEMSEALNFRERKVAPIILAGGIIGLIGGWGLEYWTQVIAYPLNIGGRPFNSWVSFIPPAFETTILVAAFSAVIGMLALNGFPHPYHPVFNAPRFERASQDKFFLVIEAADPRFDLEQTRAFLTGLNPHDVVEVEE
jgi:Protein of unknown function (DUF3341)